MTKPKRGDVILVEFAFSQGGGSKKRPALVLSVDDYHRSRHEIILAAITSNIERILVGDTELTYWKEAGLLFPSVVTGIIRTIKNDRIVKVFGRLSAADFHQVERNLCKIMGF
ncbi:MAG: type II toxin-antitoxin system PemK/MazF family toxin [Elusimicrobia bacterium]|nr:type II toxin-antitoxin system PemK/MazF family toxin [Elusimicrobiota bacterium]